MAVTSIDKDLEESTITLIADFSATVDQVWSLWEDPRKLERWWGPPTYPATFGNEVLAPGAHVKYHMTSPEGEKYHGWWSISEVNPPESMTFMDGFGDQNGEPVADMPVSHVNLRIYAHEGGTRMEMTSKYDSKDELQKVLDIGMEEGLREAVGQMDSLLPS